MALSIYLENGKVVVKSLATVNAAYNPAYFSPIPAKQYPTEGFLTATRVGTTNNLSITDANGKYIVYDLPYTEFKQKNGTTNIGSTVLTTVSTLNGTNYFGFDVDFNSSITSIDTRVGGAETTLTDVRKALRYDKNNGADPRGIYYDDLKSVSDSFVTVESAKATIQGGVTTNVTVEELNGISYFKFNALDSAGSYSMLTVIGKNQAGTLNLNNGTLLRFDNGTNNASIGISSLTANRSLVLPDASGTIALTSDIGTSGIASLLEDTTPQLGGTLDVNGNKILDATDALVTIEGDFEVRNVLKNRPSLLVTDSLIKFHLADSNNDSQAVYVHRDGSTSGDVVALNIGSNLKIKRNGSGTPQFDAGNAGFIYSQNYDVNNVSNCNVFNNGAGFGARGAGGSIFGLFAAGKLSIFGGVNSAGAGMWIMNPAAYSRPSGVGPYISGGSHSTSFKHAGAFEITRGEKTVNGDFQRNIFSAGMGVLRANSLVHTLNGTMISAGPCVEVSTDNGDVYVTNGSNLVSAALANETLRGYVAAGMKVYIADQLDSAFPSTRANYVRYEIASVDLVNHTFTLTTNYSGTTGIANAWIQDKILRVEEYSGHEALTVRPGRTVVHGNLEADAVDFDLVNPPSLTDGRLAYDIDRETLVFQSEHGELAIGEGYKPVYNNTGSDIPAGTVVQAIGVNGEKFLIEPFDASAGVSEELYFIGVTQKQINNATAGIVVSEGYVKHLNTSGYTLETILYASETPGELTATKPASPNLGIPVAMVTKVDGANGTIYVRPTIYAHLEELHDVLITSAALGEVLKYDGTKWVNGTVSASGLSSTGDVTVQLDSDNNTSGSKFKILSGSGATIFSIDEDGNTEGLLTVGTPSVTLGASSYQVGSSGAAIISGYSSAISYTADIYSSGGINQNITITNTSGLLTWTNPPIIATDWELRVFATKAGLLQSAVSIDTFDTTASTTFSYWRLQGVNSSGTAVSSKIYADDIIFYTGISGGGTAYPTTNLTSNTSESGITISSGYIYNSTYDPWKAFDSQTDGSGWWSLGNSTAANNWIQLQFTGGAVNIQSVFIRVSTAWTDADYIQVLGSNTGSFSGEEVLCGTFTGVSTSSDTAGITLNL